jgi:hypothetical protein
MPDWLIFLHWFTFIWLLGWTIRAVLNICSKDRRSVSLLLLVFFIYYGMPIFLDFMFGPPDYEFLPGFRDGAASESVNIIYDLFVIVCPVFWWFTGSSPRRSSGPVVIRAGREVEWVLWIFLASPVVALDFAPEPAVYLNYAATLGNIMSPAATSFHGVIGSLSIISIVAGAGLLLVRRSLSRTFWLILPFITVAVWLQGKRSIVAFAFLLVWAIAWMRGALTRARVIALGCITVTAFGAYSAWYQQAFRPLAVADSSDIYENVRVDYGRDHELKAAILCELSDGTEQILDYRGESMLFLLTMYVPRSWWPGKPLTYATYLTAFAVQIQPDFDLGWGLTSSFLDEAVANFGWVGLLIGPLVFAMLCRICDKNPDRLVKGVGLLVMGLLMSVQIVAFAPLVILWFLHIGWSHYASRRALGRRSSLQVRAVRAQA